jgi:Cupin domain
MTDRPTLARVYADEEGNTHLGSIDLPEARDDRGGRGRERTGIPATTVAITEMLERRRSAGLHPPPRRQFVVVMRGAFEVITTSGDRARLGTGDCVLVDDVGSKGHTFEDVGDEPLVTLQIGLADDWEWPCS